jgi:HK97 family phage portal protein
VKGGEKLGVLNNMAGWFRRDKVTASRIIDLLRRGNGLLEINRDLYSIPEIRTAINFIAEKVGCVPFFHVRADMEGNIQLLRDKVNYVLTVRANPLQGPQVFITHLITRLLLTNNAYAIPDWAEDGSLRALYPLPYSRHEFITLADGSLVIRFPADPGFEYLYEDVIHLQRFPGTNGGTWSQATGNYVQIVSTIQNQAVKDSESSGRVSALLQVKSQLKGSDMKKKLEEFKELFLNSENSTGFGMIGMEYDVHKLDMKLNPLDSKLMESITRSLYNYFGVSTEIINGNATELQYEQFVDNTVKPVVYQLEEELTYKLFSRPELERNHRVQAELIDLEISTLTAKTQFYKEMVYGTIMNRNEIRRRIGLPRGPKKLDEFTGNKNFEPLEDSGSKDVQPPAGAGKGGAVNEDAGETIPGETSAEV